MGSTVLDLTAARRWAVASRSLLSESREKIDRLNVFPVPDGDTGTNMFLTVDGALAELRVASDETSRRDQSATAPTESLRLSDGLARLAHGMLLSARGNSGVILSQLARGMSQAVHAADPDAVSMSATVLTDAFARASDVAWAGVSRPIEGTILSVARAAAQGAQIRLTELEEGTSQDPRHTHGVALAALDAARAALARTPEQLPSLARAGVVDAGGAGFVLVLEALEGVLADRAHDGAPRSTGEWDYSGIGAPASSEAIPGDRDIDWAATCPHPEHDGGQGGQEVMYIVRCDPAGAADLKEHLVGLGSSVMVVGGPEIWRVHVHLDDTAAALDAGSRVGPVQQVTITSLHRPQDGDDLSRSSAGVAIVCCAPGPGLARLFTSAGARVVHSAAGNRASTGSLLQAARDLGAAVVTVLPNDGDTVLAARAAADEGARLGLDLRVVPTVAAVQGLAALSMWDAERADSLDVMLDEMAGAAKDMSYGALVTATSSADTAAGPCRPGQWLGLAQGKIVSVTDEMDGAAADVLAHLAQWAPDGGEALTVVAGEGHHASDLDAVIARWIDAAALPPGDDLEVRRLWGGQRTYPWLLGLE
ncbi:MAG: DAK2 domain-containing protein [Ornithinimicrobium sp.]